MAFSLSPAVMIRELDATETIPARYNAPAAIAGVFKWGPVMTPTLVSTETDVVNIFHKPSDLNAETWFVAASFLAYSDRLYITRTIDGALYSAEATTTFKGKYPGDLGNSVGISYVGSQDSFRKKLLNVGDDSGLVVFGSNRFKFANSMTQIDDLNPGDTLVVGSDTIGYQNLEVLSCQLGADTNPGDPQVYNVILNGVYALPETDKSKLSFTREWKYSSIIANAPIANHIHVVVSDVDGKISGVAGTVLETYSNLSLTPGTKNADGSASYYKTVIDNRSNWVDAGTSTPATVAEPVYMKLSGGSDGAGEGAIAFAKVAGGYDLYRNSEDIDVSYILQGKAIGGVRSSGLANYIISNILTNRNDCVATVSPGIDSVDPSFSTIAKINNSIAWRNAIINTSYAFADTGYKYQYDRYSDVYRWVPMNGDTAGLMAKVDPWISPAGYKNGLIKNALKLSYSPNKAQRDLLYGSDINPVMSQVGQGILLFGDKTMLGRSSAFDRINVRRTFIEIEKAVATASAFFLFDNNDEFTQTQFKNMVVPYLKNIQGRRGIIDFRVVSDGTVNTPSVIDTNTFKGIIMIKPARSINYIDLLFAATNTATQFDELESQIS